MKKFLASMLAVSMIASMGATALAATSSTADVITGKYDKVSPETAYEGQVKNNKYDKENGYPITPEMIGPFGYNADDKNLTTDSVEFGETAYFLLTNLVPDKADGTDPNDRSTRLVTDSKSVDGLNVKAEWEEGKDLSKGLSIVKRKVQSIGHYEYVDVDKDDKFVENSSLITTMTDAYGFKEDNNEYYYMLAAKIGESTSTSDADLIGVLTFSKSKKPKADDIEYDIGINVDWENSYRKPANQGGAGTGLELDDVADDIGPLLAGKYYSAKFNGDEEIEISFEDESTFNVDISGQGKLLMYYDSEHNSKVSSRYPLAELNFWNGNGAQFNRTGEFFLRVGDDAEDYAQYLYLINSDGTLSEVPGAEYDEGDGGFYFKTRTLGSYVYSDMELDAATTPKKDDTVAPPVAPVTPVAPVVPINPGTGAKA